MLKFFAKYQKIILVVGGSLLMVVFLLPAGGQFLAPDYSNPTVGEIDGQDITQNQVNTAQAEVELLARINPQWDRMFRYLEIDGLTWLLMQHEAIANGVYAPLTHASSTVRDILEATPQLAIQLGQMRVTEEQFARALQHMEMFTQLQSMTLGVRRPSEQRLAHFAKDIRSEATVRMIALKAADRIDTVAAFGPADADVQAHFDKYKGQRPGESEPYGFGYRLPDRFKIEWVTIPLKRVATTIAVDDLAGQKYYKEHLADFLPGAAGLEPDNKVGPDTNVVPAPGSEGEDKGQDDTDTEAPATDAAPAPDAEPAGEPESNEDEAPVDPLAPVIPSVPDSIAIPKTPETPKRFEPLPYREVRQRVFEKLTDELARKKRDQIAQAIEAELTNSLRRNPNAKQQPSGYYKFEKGFEAPSFEETMQMVQQRHGVLVDLERVDDSWLTADDIDQMGGLGSASITFRETPVSVSQYIASARAFDPQSAGPLATLLLQENVHSRIVYDAAGNAYLFRLIGVEPAHEPESLDEPGVREKVVKDLKTLTVYRQLLAQRDELVETARTGGLSKLAEQQGVESVLIPAFTGRDTIRAQYLGELLPPSLPVVGESEQFVDGVFDLARTVEDAGGLKPGGAGDKAVAAIPVDAQMILAIVQLTEYEPVDTATYARMKPALNSALIQLDAREIGAAGNPLSRDAIAKRVGFTRPAGWDTDDDADADDDDADKPDAEKTADASK